MEAAINRPSVELATAIAECWLADVEMHRIAPATWGDCEKPYDKMRARVFLAKYNVLASEALWDGLKNRAINLMTKHGFGDRRGTSVPDKVSKAYRQHALSKALVTKNRMLNRRSAWDVCK